MTAGISKLECALLVTYFCSDDDNLTKLRRQRQTYLIIHAERDRHTCAIRNIHNSGTVTIQKDMGRGYIYIRYLPDSYRETESR